jgi:pimeloyl-ACP methyl ester carboxylesterase
LFGEGLTSSLLTGLCGPLAVVVSKTGEWVDQVGQRMGWWESLGSLKKPLPPSKLKELPAATIQRPIVLVPGWQTPQDRFDHLAEKLTGDQANGGRVYFVKNGDFFADLDCTQRLLASDAGAKVFVAVFPASNTPPNETANDLARSLKAIQRLTGSQKVDVTGYSMGGLATRLYLDQGGDAVGRFLMLGTPNQGSTTARTALGLLDLQQKGWDTDWLLSRKPLTEDDRAALGWLRPVDGGSHNPQLSDLNSRWENQKSRVEMIRLLGSNSRPTLGRYFLPTLGDGTVAGDGLRVGQEEPMYLRDSRHRNHGLLFSNPDTYLEMRSFFGWDQGTP